ncbi:hypothetical protein TNCV_1741841 [Trichonephila clavipes]|nr:hypothetical protein TNCV_1741841 [Trichonephila clavipes]
MATGSYLNPIYSRSQSEVQGDLHNWSYVKTVTLKCLGNPLVGRDRLNAHPGYRTCSAGKEVVPWCSSKVDKQP